MPKPIKRNEEHKTSEFSGAVGIPRYSDNSINFNINILHSSESGFSPKLFKLPMKKRRQYIK